MFVWNSLAGVTAVTLLVKHVTHSTIRASSCEILLMPTKTSSRPYRRKSQEMNCLTQSRLSPAHNNKTMSRYRTRPRSRTQRKLCLPRDAFRQLTWQLVPQAKRRAAREICAWAMDALIRNISQFWCQGPVKVKAKSVLCHSRREMIKSQKEQLKCQFPLLILAEILV